MSKAEIDSAKENIIIKIPLDYLQIIALGGWSTGYIEEPIEITDIEKFTKELCYAMNDEDEGGRSLVHRMIDDSIELLTEYGYEGFEITEENRAEEIIERYKENG